MRAASLGSPQRRRELQGSQSKTSWATTSTQVSSCTRADLDRIAHLQAVQDDPHSCGANTKQACDVCRQHKTPCLKHGSRSTQCTGCSVELLASYVHNRVVLLHSQDVERRMLAKTAGFWVSCPPFCRIHVAHSQR